MKARILIAEDDANIRLGLVATLESEGYDVVAAADGAQALKLYPQQKYDLVILDVMMPKASGYDVCRELRAAGVATPVLLLTAKGEELDKVVGLKLGADDYVVKPFGIHELLARVEALLRRGRLTAAGAAAATAASVPAVFRLGVAEIDRNAFTARRPGHAPESLTARELKLAETFAAHPGATLTRDALLNAVWGVGYFGTTRTLDQHVAQLRKSQAASLVVVDGVPYLFDCGYGAVRQLVASGVGIQRVSTLFLTHLHNDHTSDIAALLSLQWTGTKTAPTEIYGPYGTARLVAGAIEFFRADVEIRTVDEGRNAPPEALYHGHDVQATATPTEVLKDERVRVTAAESEHFLERARSQMPHRALAYRIDTKERSIVFSGDTPYSKNLVALARDADVFVCEVMAQSVYEQMMARAKADADAGNPNSVSRHVAETHSTPAVVGRMAAEAKVKTVVLNHQLPGARVPGGVDFPVTSFIDGVRAQFGGEVIVGQDLMVL